MIACVSCDQKHSSGQLSGLSDAPVIPSGCPHSDGPGARGFPGLHSIEANRKRSLIGRSLHCYEEFQTPLFQSRSYNLTNKNWTEPGDHRLDRAVPPVP